MIDLKGYSSVKDLVKDLVGALTVAVEEADKEVAEDFDERVLTVIHALNYVKIEDILRKMDLPYQDSLALKRIKESLERLKESGDIECQKYMGETFLHVGVRPANKPPQLKVSNAIG